MFSALRIAFLAVILAATIAAPAQADWKVDRAQAIASIVWNDPCGAQPLELTWEPMTVTATVHDDERPPYPRCHIRFDSGERLGWLSFCSYMIHEYGHLADFQDPLNAGPGWSDTAHSHNDESIMAVFFNDDARCRHRGRPYLEAHGLLTPSHARRVRCRPGRGKRRGSGRACRRRS